MTNLFSLEGKNAWVTGGCYGIGFAIAKAFAQAGASHIIFNARSQEAIDKAYELYRAEGITNVHGYVCDVTDEKAVKALVEQIHAEVGQIDILVNNAGITRDGLMMRMNEQQWDEVIGTNLKSAFNFIKACTPQMMRQRSGNILCVSSVVGLHGNAGQTNYSASKAGLIGLTKSVAKEMASRGIRANVIAPGFVLTEMTTGKIPEEKLAEWCKSIPLQRGAQPQEIAKAALFLVSDDSSYVTGQVLQVDGGMSM